MNRGDYMKPECNALDEFRSFSLPDGGVEFEELKETVQFGNCGKGRQGAVLVLPDDKRGVPIVRTTTKYDGAAQCLQPVHKRLVEVIQETVGFPVGFNNALVECYSNAYSKMGFHSDQALDLEENSVIAAYSCYQYPERIARKLVVESKTPGDSSTYEIPLRHNSVVLFSLETNRRFKHKIVLEAALTGQSREENQWLGFTFRLSKTFVQYRNEQVYFEDGETPLTLADGEQRALFFSHRKTENEASDYTYERLTYTISKSDLMEPVQ